MGYVDPTGCRALEVETSTSIQVAAADLEHRIKEICATRVRYGRVHVLLRREGSAVNRICSPVYGGDVWRHRFLIILQDQRRAASPNGDHRPGSAPSSLSEIIVNLAIIFIIS
jgi:hypothetical protein